MDSTAYQIEYGDILMLYNPSAGTITETRGSHVRTLAARISRNDQRNVRAFIDSQSGRWSPHCLTIYLNHTCNLECDYCYVAGNATAPHGDISMSAVEAAAEVVARACSENNRPFIVGFHGGNEPLLNRTLVEDSLECCRKVAGAHNLPMSAFCTTNGVVSQSTAAWAARTFQGITLSLDGYQSLHDMHRRLTGNGSTFDRVMQTAEVFRKTNGARITIRVTVTNDSVNHLLEIIQFIGELGFHTVQLYPVFPGTNGDLNKGLAVDQTDFVFNFLKARSWGKERGMTVLFSGTRWDEDHDRFCMLHQNNLTITPDGFLTACFRATHNRDGANERSMFGRFDERTGELCIDWQKLESISRNIQQTNPQCDNCFNDRHCAKNCPVSCPLSGVDGKAGFDCTMLKWIGLANIFEAAGHVTNVDNREECIKYFRSIKVTTVPANDRHE